MVAVPSIGRADRPQLAHSAPEADATRRLYEQYARQIYAYCLQQLRSKEEAEDATQSTFLNAFRGLQRGIDPEFESAWLYKIAQNVCLTRQRSSTRRRRVESPGDLESMKDVLPAREVPADELIGLPEALHGMPEQQRRALLLREWQGLSYREIAAELELSQAAVETLIFRARRTLAGGLAEPKSRRGDLSSLVAILKSLLFTGGVKVAATVATVAATSVVAVTPTARHAVEHVVVNLDPPAAKPAHVVHRPAATPAAHVVARRSAPPAAAAPALAARKAAPKHHAHRPARHRPAPHHELAASVPRHALAGHVPADPAPAAPAVPPAAAPPAPPAPAPAPPAPAATPAVKPAAPAPAAPAPQPAAPTGNGRDKDKGNGGGVVAAPVVPVPPVQPAPPVAPAVPTVPDAPVPAAPGNARDHAIQGPPAAPTLVAPIPSAPTATTPSPAPPATTTTTTTATPTPGPAPPNARSGGGVVLGP